MTNESARLLNICQITGSTDFPSKYYANQWLENVPVIEGVIKIWANVHKYVAAVEASKTQTKKHVFCNCVAGIQGFAVGTQACACQLQNFAKSFDQVPNTDAPMIKCLCNDLFRLTKQLLEQLIKSGMMKQPTTPIQLFKDNFHKEFSQSITKIFQQSMLDLLLSNV